jgi:hypothetical protein
MSGEMKRAIWSGVVAAVVAGLPVSLCGADDEAVRKAAERDIKALGWLLQQGMWGMPEPVAPINQQPDNARREQIKQQAKQMERFFQPMLHAELELIRRTCGSLSPAGRRAILEVGRKAVVTAAGGMAERQLTGRLGRDPFDPRAEIRTSLAAAVAREATPAEVAGYREAVEQRESRRAAAARVVIVARVDRQLDLSARQREAVEAELQSRWQPDWIGELETRSVRINNYPPAPERVAAAVLPHLDAAQLTLWEQWCRAAGSRAMPPHFNLNLDGQGIQQLDPWWVR